LKTTPFAAPTDVDAVRRRVRPAGTAAADAAQRQVQRARATALDVE